MPCSQCRPYVLVHGFESHSHECWLWQCVSVLYCFRVQIFPDKTFTSYWQNANSLVKETSYIPYYTFHFYLLHTCILHQVSSASSLHIEIECLEGFQKGIFSLLKTYFLAICETVSCCSYVEIYLIPIPIQLDLVIDLLKKKRRGISTFGMGLSTVTSFALVDFP